MVSLLSLPKEYFPPFFAMNLQPVMSMLVRVVSTIDEEEDEDEDEEDDEDEDEEDEDYNARNGAKVSKSTLKKLSKTKVEIPEDGFEEDEDCINVADEDYLEAMAEVANAGKKYDQYGDDMDDLDESDEPDTPLDAEDMTILFCDSMNQSFHRDPELFGGLQNGLDDEDKERLRVILETAEYRKTHPDSEEEDEEA
jgi:hypothetical protein